MSAGEGEKMLTLVYGAKGSGKTKRIISLANESIDQTNGEIVFITDTNRYMFDIKYQIRAINIKEHSIVTQEGMIGFFKGVLAGNHDITHMFIDGIHRIINKDVADLEWVYKKLEEIAAKSDVKFIVTVSKDKGEIPDYLQKYIKD